MNVDDYIFNILQYFVINILCLVLNLMSSTKTGTLSQNIIHFLYGHRLKVLAARQQVLNDLFMEAKTNLKSISMDQSRYADLLKNLLLQVSHDLLFHLISKFNRPFFALWSLLCWSKLVK